MELTRFPNDDIQPRSPCEPCCVRRLHFTPELVFATAFSAMREERVRCLNVLSFAFQRWRPLSWPDARCQCLQPHERRASQRLVGSSAGGMRIACGQLRRVLGACVVH